MPAGATRTAKEAERAGLERQLQEIKLDADGRRTRPYITKLRTELQSYDPQELVEVRATGPGGDRLAKRLQAAAHAQGHTRAIATQLTQRALVDERIRGVPALTKFVFVSGPVFGGALAQVNADVGRGFVHLYDDLMESTVTGLKTVRQTSGWKAALKYSGAATIKGLGMVGGSIVLAKELYKVAEHASHPALQATAFGGGLAFDGLAATGMILMAQQEQGHTYSPYLVSLLAHDKVPGKVAKAMGNEALQSELRAMSPQARGALKGKALTDLVERHTGPLTARQRQTLLANGAFAAELPNAEQIKANVISTMIKPNPFTREQRRLWVVGAAMASGGAWAYHGGDHSGWDHIMLMHLASNVPAVGGLVSNSREVKNPTPKIEARMREHASRRVAASGDGDVMAANQREWHPGLGVRAAAPMNRAAKAVMTPVKDAVKGALRR